MVAIITGAIVLIILAAVAGWFFGTWQTRLRFKLNVEKKWNEGDRYFRYWNPWNRTKHFAFTERDLATPRRRAEMQPEDTRIPL